jgi:hypothetical protein
MSEQKPQASGLGILIESLADDLTANADNPQIVRERAEELRQIAASFHELLHGLDTMIRGYMAGKKDLANIKKNGETQH